MAANGQRYDWESITVTGPQGEIAEISEIKYEDGQSATARYGRGSVPHGYGRGNYEASGSMVLGREEWEKLKKELTALGAASMTMNHLRLSFPTATTICPPSRIR